MTQDAAPIVSHRRAAPAFPVVVLAASAGGIQALGHIFRALPADFRAALAVVQHRDPRVPGLLAAVLQRSSTLPVQDAASGDRLQPGRISLAPANRHLVVEPDGSLSLSTAAPVRSTRPAADVLFASVAPVFTTRVIAVVLTGYDSDGTHGIQIVKQWGGMVIAQDEASSEVFGMPRSAIATGAVDDVLALQEIAPALVAHVTRLTRAQP
jgi:two-component system chemotaxis response regulator CheB